MFSGAIIFGMNIGWGVYCLSTGSIIQGSISVGVAAFMVFLILYKEKDS